LDTNVIVSGFLNPHGAPGRLVQMVAAATLTLAFDARVLLEYREVLVRPAFGLRADAVDAFLEQVEAQGQLVACRPLPAHLPDPDDEPFVEVALAAGGVPLVTGNVRHFPEYACAGVPVWSPVEALDVLRVSSG